MSATSIAKIMAAAAIGAAMYCCTPSRTYTRRITQRIEHVTIQEQTVEEIGKPPGIEILR